MGAFEKLYLLSKMFVVQSFPEKNRIAPSDRQRVFGWRFFQQRMSNFC